MKVNKLMLSFTFLSSLLVQVVLTEPLTLSLLAIAFGSATLYLFSNDGVITKELKRGFTYVGEKIGFYEGCEDYWIHDNIAGLEFDLKEEVFGQPLALDIILGTLKNHLRKKNQPNRALMLSFNGGPGTGKNFISQIILKNMFRKGSKTDYVHFFRGSIDFPSKSKTEEYQDHIVRTVQDMVYKCHRSVFIFDEVEKMPEGILDVLSEIIGAGQLKDYDFRRVIFILLSNIGGDLLIKETLEHMKQGNRRESMDANYLNKLLATAAYNEKGGLRHAGIVKNRDISYFVPFIPLEKQHVEECLKREVTIQKQIVSEELIEQVLEEMSFGPPPYLIFAHAGCKGVAEKAAVLIERETRRAEQAERRTL